MQHPLRIIKGKRTQCVQHTAKWSNFKVKSKSLMNFCINLERNLDSNLEFLNLCGKISNWDLIRQCLAGKILPENARSLYLASGI